MRFLLINENNADFIDIPNTNESIEKALGWDDAWNTPTINIGGVPFIAICSDTGKVRHEPVSAISFVNLIAPKETLQETFLVGPIIISKFDGTDDFESLNDQDVDLLRQHLWHHNMKDRNFYKTMLIID